MGRSTLIDVENPLFELSVSELIQLQSLVVRRRHRHYKQHIGAALSQSKIRGRGMDFVETRNYYPGDDIRLMDWRVTARTNKPHVKVFQVERERPVMIFCDFAPSMYFGTKLALKTVVMAKLAALLAWTARAHGDRVGGVVSSLVKQNLWLPHAHNLTLINFLKGVSDASAKYQDKNWINWHSQENQGIFVRGIKELLKTLKPGTLVLFLSDWRFEASAVQNYLLELRSHHDMMLFQIADPIELAPLEPGLYPISDGNQVQLLNFYDAKARDDYQNFCQQKIDKMKQLAKKIGVAHHLVSSETDLSQLVQQSFLRRLGG